MRNEQDEQREMIRALLLDASSPCDWLAIMKFGLNWLIDDQSLLIDALVARAKLNAAGHNTEAVELKAIMRKLGLRFLPAGHLGDEF